MQAWALCCFPFCYGFLSFVSCARYASQEQLQKEPPSTWPKSPTSVKQTRIVSLWNLQISRIRRNTKNNEIFARTKKKLQKLRKEDSGQGVKNINQRLPKGTWNDNSHIKRRKISCTRRLSKTQRGIKTDGFQNDKFLFFNCYNLAAFWCLFTLVPMWVSPSKCQVFFFILKLGILVPVYFGTPLGVSLAAPKGVSKRMVFKMVSSRILKDWQFGARLFWYPFGFLQMAAIVEFLTCHFTVIACCGCCKFRKSRHFTVIGSELLYFGGRCESNLGLSMMARWIRPHFMAVTALGPREFESRHPNL